LANFDVLKNVPAPPGSPPQAQREVAAEGGHVEHDAAAVRTHGTRGPKRPCWCRRRSAPAAFDAAQLELRAAHHGWIRSH
jgi:hypothetical protein